MSTSLDDQIRMVQRLRESGRRGTTWEQNFLESIDDQLGEGRTLTERQLEILHKIEADWERPRPW